MGKWTINLMLAKLSWAELEAEHSNLAHIQNSWQLYYTSYKQIISMKTDYLEVYKMGKKKLENRFDKVWKQRQDSDSLNSITTVAHDCSRLDAQQVCTSCVITKWLILIEMLCFFVPA